jgi:hypothetical protein
MALTTDEGFRFSEMERRLTEVEAQMGTRRERDEARKVARLFDEDTHFIRVIDVETDPLDVASTTDETSLYSVNLPGGTLTGGDIVEMIMLGSYRNDSGGNANLTLKLMYGSQTIWAETVTGIPPGASRTTFTIHCYLVPSDNSLAAQDGGGWFLFGDFGGATTGFGEFATPLAGGGFRGTATVDSTIDQTLDMRFQHSVSNAAVEMERRLAFTRIA